MPNGKSSEATGWQDHGLVGHDPDQQGGGDPETLIPPSRVLRPHLKGWEWEGKNNLTPPLNIEE